MFITVGGGDTEFFNWFAYNIQHSVYVHKVEFEFMKIVHRDMCVCVRLFHLSGF